MKSSVGELPGLVVIMVVQRRDSQAYVRNKMVACEELPLPQHLDEWRILDAIRLEKDVDGVHPLNIGNLAIHGREPLCIPCTPKGCVELLLRSDVEIVGKKAVVIGSNVGLPTTLLECLI
ncbi:hypothetical protein ACH5RR_015395 [Cinchona calisaya]|uniref:Tetrahydrofolate dehydrogenase/cyclohydrolase NAD(P)-binding domain-containing protein n=1 Tax=Cinchona calisaya TaxID=153742 RepID=A0ABD2ZT23_9GENT